MCKHNDVKIIAAKSGEWWWCEDCGEIRDPEGRWFKPKRTALPRVALREPTPARGGPTLRVAEPGGPVRVDPSPSGPFTPKSS